MCNKHFWDLLKLDVCLHCKNHQEMFMQKVESCSKIFATVNIIVCIPVNGEKIALKQVEDKVYKNSNKRSLRTLNLVELKTEQIQM